MGGLLLAAEADALVAEAEATGLTRSTTDAGVAGGTDGVETVWRNSANAWVPKDRQASMLVSSLNRRASELTKVGCWLPESYKAQYHRNHTKINYLFAQIPLKVIEEGSIQVLGATRNPLAHLQAGCNRLIRFHYTIRWRSTTAANTTTHIMIRIRCLS